MRDILSRISPVLMAIFLVGAIFSVVGDYDEPVSNIQSVPAKVVRVIDGDTLEVELNSKREKVRLIGVDAPESANANSKKNTLMGKKAEELTRKTLWGKNVILKFDVQKRDKWKRLLCYVYIDGKMYNKTIIREGLAKIVTIPPNIAHEAELIKLQDEAKTRHRGIWNQNSG